jgi:hypothetical protein
MACRRSAPGQIVAHADLVPVTDDRRSGQGKHQAVGEFEPPLIAVEHRRPAADTAVKSCMSGSGPTPRTSLRCSSSGGQIELVMIAQE